MTHLAAFSYPSRLFIISVTFLFVYLMNRAIFRYSWREALQKDRSIKFYCMTLIYCMLTTWMIYDIVAWVNSYYVVSSDTEPAYSPYDYLIYSVSVKDGLKKFGDALLDVTFICHSSCMFLLLSFWHSVFHLNEFEHLNFWTRWEFKFYLVYAILVFITYPAVQWPLVNNLILFTVVPQLLYWAEMILSSILILVVRYRIGVAAKNSISDANSELVANARWLMVALVFFNLLASTCLNIINIAILVQYGQYPYEVLLEPAPVGPGLGNNLTPGVKDLLTAAFSVSYLPIAVFTVVLLNTGKLVSVRNLSSQSSRRDASRTPTGGPSSYLSEGIAREDVELLSS